MPAGVVIAGAALIAGGIAYGAAESDRMRKEAKDAADKAEKERNERYNNMIKLAKKQYNRWEQDFGEIQTEVADYYKNLNDDILKQQYEDANTEANQSLIQQYFAAQKNLSSQFNKTGMAGSGAEAASTLKLQQSMLQQKATNRWQTQQLKANAQNAIMGQKQQWVSQGENLRSQAMQNQFNAEQIIGNDAAARNLQYQQQAYNAEQNMVNTISSGLVNMGGMTMGLTNGMDWSNPWSFSSTQNTQYGITSTNVNSTKISPSVFASLNNNNLNPTIANVNKYNALNNFYNDNTFTHLGLNTFNTKSSMITNKYR